MKTRRKMNPVLTETPPSLVQLVPEKGCTHQLPLIQLDTPVSLLCWLHTQTPFPQLLKNPRTCPGPSGFGCGCCWERRTMKCSQRGHQILPQWVFALASWQRKINSEWVTLAGTHFLMPLKRTVRSLRGTEKHWCILNLGMTDDQMKFILDDYRGINIGRVFSVTS